MQKKTTLLIILLIIGIAGFWLGKGVATPSIDNDPQIEKKREKHSGTRPKYFSPIIKDKRILRSSVTSKELSLIINKLLKGETPKNWENDLNVLLKHDLSVEATEALIVFFSKWAEIDFNKAFEVSSELDAGTSYIVQRELLSQMVEQNLENALLFYKKNETSLESTLIYYLLGEIAQNRALKDPEETLLWGLSQKDKSKEYTILFNFMYAFGLEKDSAKSYIERIYSQKGSVHPDIISSWAFFNTDAALKWLESSQEYDDYTPSVIQGIARKDLDMAINLFMQLPEEKQKIHFETISSAIPDTGDALSWVMSIIPNFEITSNEFVRLNSWAEENPDESKSWIQLLPTSSAKDIAIEIYASNAPTEIPYESLLELIDSMKDPKAKQTSLEVIQNRWGK